MTVEHMLHAAKLHYRGPFLGAYRRGLESYACGVPRDRCPYTKMLIRTTTLTKHQLAAMQEAYKHGKLVSWFNSRTERSLVNQGLLTPSLEITTAGLELMLIRRKRIRRSNRAFRRAWMAGYRAASHNFSDLRRRPTA